MSAADGRRLHDLFKQEFPGIDSAIRAEERAAVAAELRELLRGAEADEDHLVGTGGDNAAWCEGVLGGLRRALAAVEGTNHG